MWSALVLTTAGLLSAWASFQGGMWGGLEAEHFHRSNAALTVSSAKAIAAGQRETEHAGLFVSWLAAVSDGKEKRARFLENQFEPPFDAEFRRWRSALPDDLSTADDFVTRPQFMGLLSGPAEAARKESQAETVEANRSGDIADRYDRWTVVLATALFLAGIGAVLKNPRARRVIDMLAAALTAVSILSLALLPVSLGG